MSRFYIPCGTVTTRSFRLDLAGDGRRQLCLQVEDNFYVVDGKTINNKRPSRLVVPIDEDEPNHYAEVSGTTLRMMNGIEEVWSQQIARRRFGLGIGRTSEDELSFDLDDFFGFYREKTEVRSLGCHDVNQDGKRELLVFTSTGWFLVYSLEGSLIWRKRLLKGAFNSSQIISAPENADDETTTLLISSYCRSRRTWFFWYSLEYEWTTFVIEKLHLTDSHWRLGVSHAVPGKPGHFIGSERENVCIEKGKLKSSEAEDSGFSLLEKKRLFARDASDPSRVLALSLGESRQSITAEDPDGQKLWSHLLGILDGEVELRSATLGSKGTAADSMVAVLYSIKRNLAEYNTDISEYHVMIFGPDAEVVATHTFPTSSDDGQYTNALFFDDVDNDGIVELLALGQSKAIAFEVPMKKEPPSEPEHDIYTGVPTFPTPPEDLWDSNLPEDPAANDFAPPGA